MSHHWLLASSLRWIHFRTSERFHNFSHLSLSQLWEDVEHPDHSTLENRSFHKSNPFTWTRLPHEGEPGINDNDEPLTTILLSMEDPWIAWTNKLETLEERIDDKRPIEIKHLDILSRVHDIHRSIMKITLTLFVLFFGLVGASCPDGSRCPDDESSTCCRAKSGYSCCPLPNAVCCDNGVYCCPAGMSCNLKDGTCVHHLTATPNTTSDYSSGTENYGEHTCPDRKHKCSDDSTCCLISPSLYGCCPYRDAVCCSDNEHCCPPGSTCNLAETRCDLALVPTTPNFHTVCPGGEFVCPEA